MSAGAFWWEGLTIGGRGPTEPEGLRGWRQSLAEDQALDSHRRCDDQKTNRDPWYGSAI